MRYYWNQLWEYNPATPAWTAVPTATPTKVDTNDPPYYYTPVVYDSGDRGSSSSAASTGSAASSGK